MVQFVSNTAPLESMSVFPSVASRNSDHTLSENMQKRCVNLKTEMEEEDGLAAGRRPSIFKRPKFAVPNSPQQWSVPSGLHSQAAYFNPLDEPSPLGLTLRKTPSLLDLIQFKLSQEDPTCLRNTNSLNQDAGKRKDARSAAAQASADKLKASNFPVSILRIGTWECLSRYEGDLVAKCYFAKHKLVWEVLDGGLKSKIEIQWSDITALKASCPENEPGTLDIELSRPPLFFKETNPQPRKHTLWQATSDFTGGQATVCRRHFLQCPHGLLNRHYEKLIQCDHRLNLLSNKPFISGDPPYFDSRSAVFQHQNENSYDAPPPLPQMLVPKCEPSEPEASTEDSTHQETTSPSSVMDSRAIEDHGSSDNDELNLKGSKQSEQLRFLEALDGLSDQGSGLALSTSMSNLVNQIGICFQEQRPVGNFVSTGEDTSASNKKILDAIAQHLLSDCLLSACDEQSIIARVNSMCSLLQKDVSIEHASDMNVGKAEEPIISYSMRSCPNVDGEDDNEIDNDRSALSEMDDLVSSHLVENSSVDSKCSTVMSRKESSGDLLLHLPRIASLPQFFIQAPDELGTRNESNGMVGGTHLR